MGRPRWHWAHDRGDGHVTCHARLSLTWVVRESPGSVARNRKEAAVDGLVNIGVFFAGFFGGLGVFFIGCALLWATSVWKSRA